MRSKAPGSMHTRALMLALSSSPPAHSCSPRHIGAALAWDREGGYAVGDGGGPERGGVVVGE
eukprot:2832163-Rhodomonas_salina.1